MKNKKATTQMTIVLGIVFALIAIVYFFFLNDNAYQMSADGFQIVSGEKKEFSKGVKFVYQENGITYQGAKDNEYLSSSPLYFNDDKNAILTAQEFVYVEGKSAKMRKTPTFSTIRLNQGIHCNNIRLLGGFLFDGNNTYVFLEKMSVKVNGREVHLTPLSTMVVNGNTIYFYYDNQRDQIEMDYIYTDSIIAKCDDYEIDLINDILMIDQEEKVLLYTKPELLDELK